MINHRYFVASGAERYLFNIERVLNRAGHEVAVFSINYQKNEPSPWSPWFTSPIGDVEEVYFDQHRTRPASFVKTIQRLFYSTEVEHDLTRLIEDFQPDVAYLMLFMRKLSPSVLMALRKSKVPTVVRVSDYGFLCAEHHFLRDGKTCTKCLHGRLWPGVVHGCVHDSRLVSALDAAATWYHRSRGFLDLIDRFVTTNPFLTEMMVKGGFPPERLVCIPTFADEEMFCGQPHRTRRHLLYFGRLDPSKGLETLIAAMELLRSRMDRALIPVLRIAGSPQYVDYGRELVRRVRTAGLQDCIQFDGPIPGEQIPALLRDAIASIIPSLWFENLPNSYLESICAGVPVIASDLGSLSLAIEHEKDGLLFQPGNAEALASSIERLLSDRELEDRLRREGPAKAQREYSASRHLELLTGLFTSLTGRHATRNSDQEGLRSAKEIMSRP